MSGKGSKRRQRRTNKLHEEEVVDKVVEEVIYICDDSKSTGSVDEKSEKEFSTNKENGEKSHETQETVKNGDNDLKKDPPNVEIIPPVPDKEKISAINGQSSENGSSEKEKLSEVDQTSDMESLVLEIESDELNISTDCVITESNSESPVLNRCKTRRSQNRNIPTPKTPKSTEFNGDKIVEAETSFTESENTSVLSFDISVDSNTDKIEESNLTNASVFVNLGDETSFNLDITNYNDQPPNATFIELSKDKSYGETLRSLTGRKALRRNLDGYDARLYKSNLELRSATDIIDSSKTFALRSLKRELDIDSSPPPSKRPKTENSGFFSYFKSPFKSIFSGNDITSSTPKLTSFKTVQDEPDKVLLESDQHKNEEQKKWCAIM